MKKGSVNPDLYKARVGNCVVCGSEYRAVNDFKERKQKYCSKECWSNRSPKIKVNCKYCGSEFEKYKSVRKSYCKPECRASHLSESSKGDGSHFWKGGKTSENKKIRSSVAFKGWRESVFNRDNYSCVLCDDNKDLHPHHIIHLANDKSKALDVSNGATLCSTCHSVIHNRIIGKGNKLKFKDKKHTKTIIKRWMDFTGKIAILESSGQEFKEAA